MQPLEVDAILGGDAKYGESQFTDYFGKCGWITMGWDVSSKGTGGEKYKTFHPSCESLLDRLRRWLGL
jgi:hypothetical protein